MKDGIWDWGCLSYEVPQHIKYIIQATPCALTSTGGDRLAWSASAQGNFDLRSAYKIAMGELHDDEFPGKWIWKTDILPRIKTFVWQCYHNSIGVKECLVGRGMLGDDLCPLCGRFPETIIHALRDCKSVKPMWIQLGVRWADRRFWTEELREWLELNGNKGSCRVSCLSPWRTTFLFAIWLIWKSRNQVVFNGKAQNPRIATEISNKALEFTFCASTCVKLSRIVMK